MAEPLISHIIYMNYNYRATSNVQKWNSSFSHGLMSPKAQSKPILMVIVFFCGA